MAFKDIRKSQKFLTPADIVFILGALLIVAALLALDIYLARTLQGGEWLFLRWNGVRAFLFEHIEPYGSTIAQRVQLLVYGREAFLAEYPYALNDPFYIVLLYTPFIFFSDFTIAHAVWMLLSQVALIGIVLLALRLSEWEPPSWVYIALFIFGLTSSISVDTFLSGSPAIFFTLIYLGILVALRSFADEFAGALIFLVAYQWEVGALFLIFILFFVLANRRWGVLTGFGMTLAVLLIASFLAKPDWFLAYARAVRFDWSREISYSFEATFAYLFPRLSFSFGGWLTVGIAAVLLFEAMRSVKEHPVHLIWVAFLSLAMNPLMGFAIFPTNHTVLLPAFILVLSLAWERWKNRRVVITSLLLAFVLVFFYGLYYQSLYTSLRLYADLLKILPPLLITLALYWMRWWAVRPPRIWADQLGTRK